ncbi:MULTISPECIES: oligosaccharide flippase family protein [Proteus]|uniref:Wzx n=1 Tax=Proteus penneri TaxID=102862 RepID=A0A385JNX9_9GAMM|nr:MULTISPECIES: oligosaccharide flippase family protein [Proteus]AXZ00071.1 wzx [Proteus penneri]MCX2589068.1 oligosaccharide flippase family protein [Proteus penneri]NBL76576.1 oligosaccharide flippase family protein [Proteus sp. G2672]NBL90234.1 oligosaccharide flippase family protein [Proteus sp. G2673]
MSLKKNIINLFGTQVVSYLVPLLQYPYLSRVIGTDILGLYIFSISIINISNIITTFGFDIYVAKRIAEGENSKKDVSIFIFQTSVLKIILLIIPLIIIFISKFSTSYFEDNNILLLLIFSVLVNTFNLVWLFQGLEKLYIYSRIIITTKIISLLLIFLIVKTKNDINLLFLITFFQYLLSVLLCFFYCYKSGYKIIPSSLQSTVSLLINSFEYFLSRLGTSIYSTCGSFFLGLFSGSLHQVAIYGAAEQLYKAGVYTMTAISTPLIPYMARTKNYLVFYKVTILSIIMTLIGAFIGFFYGKDIIYLIYGNNLIDAYPILCIFMITIVISIIGIQFGYPALIPINKTKIANYSVIIAGIIQLLGIITLHLLNIDINAKNITILYLASDSTMTLIRFMTFIKNRNTRNKNGL